MLLQNFNVPVQMQLRFLPRPVASEVAALLATGSGYADLSRISFRKKAKTLSFVHREFPTAKILGGKLFLDSESANAGIPQFALPRAKSKPVTSSWLARVILKVTAFYSMAAVAICSTVMLMSNPEFTSLFSSQKKAAPAVAVQQTVAPPQEFPAGPKYSAEVPFGDSLSNGSIFLYSYRRPSIVINTNDRSGKPVSYEFDAPGFKIGNEIAAKPISADNQSRLAIFSRNGKKVQMAIVYANAPHGLRGVYNLPDWNGRPLQAISIPAGYHSYQNYASATAVPRRAQRHISGGKSMLASIASGPDSSSITFLPSTHLAQNSAPADNQPTISGGSSSIPNSISQPAQPTPALSNASENQNQPVAVVPMKRLRFSSVH